MSIGHVTSVSSWPIKISNKFNRLLLCNEHSLLVFQVSHSEELALLCMTRRDFDKARHYYRLCADRFLYDWAGLRGLMSNARSVKLECLQVCLL